jgi:hypothetical protein
LSNRELDLFDRCHHVRTILYHWCLIWLLLSLHHIDLLTPWHYDWRLTSNSSTITWTLHLVLGVSLSNKSSTGWCILLEVRSWPVLNIS